MNYINIIHDLKKNNNVNTKFTNNILCKCKININNTSKPIKTVINHKDNINIRHTTKKKLETIKNNDYTQNKDISCMNINVPNLPNLFEHEFNLENDNNITNKCNKTFGQLNKEIIPISFYNHLMFSENVKKKHNKYFKASITERNKKKLITILYYTPV